MTKLRREWLADLETPGAAGSRVVDDFLRLNRALAPVRTGAPGRAAALVLCSDSRQPESIFDPEDRFHLVRTAGNLVDPGLLPKGVRGALVVGHRHGVGKGCGAVDAAAAVARTGVVPGHPDLAHVLEHCALTPEENLVRIGAALEARGVPAALLLYDHVSAALEEVRVPQALAEAAARVALATGAFRAARHDPGLAVGGISLAQGQNPRAIVLDLLPDPVRRFLGGGPQAEPYTGPMGLFVVKEGGAELSPAMLASMAYALTHALHGAGSFKDTADALLIAGSERELDLAAGRLAEGPARAAALGAFLDRGGRLTGLVAEGGRFARAARFGSA